MKHLAKDFANNVYDILVDLGGAREEDRSSFIYSFCEDQYVCSQWRFQGHFGFGGKYLHPNNSISYYRETKTEELEKLAEEVNDKLKELENEKTI